MMDKEQVAKAIGRVDNAVSQLAVNRQVHVALVNDMQLIQKCCTAYFGSLTACKSYEESKDGGTNIIPIRSEPGDEDSEGSGDSV